MDKQASPLAEGELPMRNSLSSNSQGDRPLRESRTSNCSQDQRRPSVESAPSSGSGNRRGVDSKGDRHSYYIAVTRHPKQRALLARIRQCCTVLADNKGFIIFGILLTVWALTADDLRLLFTNAPSDPIFDMGVCFCIFFFSIEILVSWIGKEDYPGSFFFGLDLISTVTLVLDLTAVSDALFNGGDDENTDKARSSKTARAGARVGRVVRVLRLVRIVKLFKVYHASQMKKKKKIEEVRDPNDFDWDADFEEDNAKGANVRESLVGKKLSSRTTHRTIVLVLVMLIVLPLLSIDSYMIIPTSAEYGADDVTDAFDMLLSNNSRRSYEDTLLKYIYYHNWYTGAKSKCPEDTACPANVYSQLFWVGITGEDDKDGGELEQRAAQAKLQSGTVKAWDTQAAKASKLYFYGSMPEEIVDTLGEDWIECTVKGNRLFGIPILKEEIDGLVSYPVKCPDQLRGVEQDYFVPSIMSNDEYKRLHFVFYFDLRPFVKDESTRNLLKTLFVCIVLCVASLFFSSDAHRLVLQPVEDMILKVEAIRDNPLSAISLADEEFKREEVKKMKTQRMKEKWRFFKMSDLRKFWQGKGKRQDMMETVILEKTIIKLGSLLALGFGQAGVNIVSHNMKGSNSANVDAMIQGSRVDCIIGVCRIREFSTVIEVLQGKVMTFVNQVAEIVHGIVDQFQGAVNKNNGDTFLIIWQIADLTDDEVTRMAEMSVVAFSRIIGAVHGSPMLATYRHHPGLQQRLRTAAGCRVNVSFGLHSGWAIEGAVGSEFKIDASYLSPHVSMTTSLERATVVYNVSILVSEEVANLCTPDFAVKLRLIDRVRIEGSTHAVQLYCMDLAHMTIPEDEPMTAVIWNTRQRYISRQKLAAEKTRKWKGAVTIAELWKVPHISVMRQPYTREFKQVFGMGYQNYTEGEWQAARQFLRRTQNMLGVEDGPSGALLSFMEHPHGFKAPAGWLGIRVLENLDGI